MRGKQREGKWGNDKQYNKKSVSWWGSVTADQKPSALEPNTPAVQGEREDKQLMAFNAGVLRMLRG